MLTLQLFSAERGCLTASGLAPFAADKPERSTAEAVSDLLQHLRQETQMPAAPESKPKQLFGGRKVEDAKPVEADDVAESVVDFASSPPSAVFVGDKMVCERTPCSQAVGQAKVSITMSAKDYVTRTETVSVTAKTRRIDWRLDPDFALLDAACDGKPLQVQLDGKSIGNCPVANIRLKSGKHTVAFSDPCFLAIEEQFEVKRADSKVIAVAPVAKMAALTVKAKDSDGNALRGSARVDGRLVGQVPGSFKIPACSKRLVVTSESNGEWSQDLALGEGEKKLVDARFKALPKPDPGEPAAAPPPDPDPPRHPFIVPPRPEKRVPTVTVTEADKSGRSGAITVLVLGLGAGLGGAMLGLTTSSDRNALQTKIDSAKSTGDWPDATTLTDAQAQVSALNSRIYGAYALGAVGVLGTGIGLWMLTRDEAPSAVSLAPWPDGRGVQVGWNW